MNALRSSSASSTVANPTTLSPTHKQRIQSILSAGPSVGCTAAAIFARVSDRLKNQPQQALSKPNPLKSQPQRTPSPLTPVSLQTQGQGALPLEPTSPKEEPIPSPKPLEVQQQGTASPEFVSLRDEEQEALSPEFVPLKEDPSSQPQTLVMPVPVKGGPILQFLLRGQNAK